MNALGLVFLGSVIVLSIGVADMCTKAGAAVKNAKGQPICGKTINGPKVGRHVVLWRKECQRVVKVEGQRCWQHGGAA